MTWVHYSDILEGSKLDSSPNPSPKKEMVVIQTNAYLYLHCLHCQIQRTQFQPEDKYTVCLVSGWLLITGFSTAWPFHHRMSQRSSFKLQCQLMMYTGTLIYWSLQINYQTRALLSLASQATPSWALLRQEGESIIHTALCCWVLSSRPPLTEFVM